MKIGLHTQVVINFPNKYIYFFLNIILHNKYFFLPFMVKD